MSIKRAGCLLLFLVLGTAAACMGASPEKTAYSRSSNKELKQKSLALVKNIRGLVDDYNKRDREFMTDYDKKNPPGASAASIRVVREQWLKETDDLHDATMKQYKDRYWSDAILLANEIYRRLPKRMRRSDILPMYQHPTNVLGVQAIADHLELIAKSLPD